MNENWPWITADATVCLLAWKRKEGVEIRKKEKKEGKKKEKRRKKKETEGKGKKEKERKKKKERGAINLVKKNLVVFGGRMAQDGRTELADTLELLVHAEDDERRMNE